MIRLLLSVLAAVLAVDAAVHDIDVGKGSALAFTPDTLTAAVGDTLNFHFYSGSGGHSVVSSTFASPCVPGPNAFFSGYINGDKTGDQTFIVNVTSTDPIWFYCSLGPHCLEGMVGVVNPPSGQNVSDYIAQASKTVVRASAPAALQGGVLTTITLGSSGSVTSMPVSSVTSVSGSSTSSEPGFSAGTTMPTTTSTSTSASTGTAGSSASTSKASSTSSGVAATSTPSGSGKNKEMPIVLGLGVIMLGLVNLMA